MRLWRAAVRVAVPDERQLQRSLEKRNAVNDSYCRFRLPTRNEGYLQLVRYTSLYIYRRQGMTHRTVYPPGAGGRVARFVPRPPGLLHAGGAKRGKICCTDGAVAQRQPVDTRCGATLQRTSRSEDRQNL
ncbi:uncharacterized protein LOC144094466 [Amblyomma americanum]